MNESSSEESNVELTEAEIIDIINAIESTNQVIDSDPFVPMWLRMILFIFRLIRVSFSASLLTISIVTLIGLSNLSIGFNNNIFMAAFGLIIMSNCLTIMSVMNEFVIEYDLCYEYRCARGIFNIPKYLNTLVSITFVSVFITILVLRTNQGSIYFNLIVAYTIIEYSLNLMLLAAGIIMMCCGVPILFPDIIIRSLSIVPIRFGASDEELNSLPQYGLDGDQLVPLDDKMEKMDVKNKEMLCIICRGSIKDADAIRVFKCKHFYHKECCDEWLKIKKICPMCRQEVTFKEQIEVK